MSTNLESVKTAGGGPDTVLEVKASLPPADAAAQKVPFRIWLVLFVSSFGVFMASVSTSALIIAFPVLLAELNMTIGVMMWVLLVLLLMIGAIVPIAGKLGDIFGQARVYQAGYCCFVIGSLGAGFVTPNNDGYDLVAARVVIGFGAALLFTNSSAILTNSFAPYNKVGLAQGVFQLWAAMGMVLGPLIGGGLATTNWRWIFWFNVPPGGLCAMLSFWVVQNTSITEKRSFGEHMKRFDFIGGLTCSLGLVLILIAMIQGVVADPVLSQTGSLVGLIVGGCVCGIVFLVDQFYATDALIPPGIFMNRTFTVTTVSGTFMAFVRNSVTYNMIFFLQGPFGMDPLRAGINLIPYGIGIMVAGFSTGAIADKVGIRTMAGLGPLVTMAGAVCLSKMTQNTSTSYLAGTLFLTGFGVGSFQSPNSMANMLSVAPNRRGVAAAISMLTMTFCMMVGIVLTFSFVLHSMTSEQLFNLFIYGGQSTNVQGCIDALTLDYYFVVAACLCASACALALPADLQQQLRSRAPPRVAPDDSTRALADWLKKALQSQSPLALPTYSRADPAVILIPGAVPAAAAPQARLADVAEPPAEWAALDVREHMPKELRDGECEALLRALALLCEEKAAAARYDEPSRLHLWSRVESGDAGGGQAS